MELYHYTDINGLKGILDNNALWATDIKFLNDSKELHAGIDKLEEICNKSFDLDKLKFLGEPLSKLSNSNTIQEMLTNAYRRVSEVIKENLKNRDIYITSFSSKRDNLRQWMSYCPGNAGYCILFDGNKLREAESKESERGYVTNLEKVHYGSSDLNKILDPQYIIDHITQNDLPMKFYRDLTSKAMFHCCAIKPKEFYDESETRLIIQSTQERKHSTNFRTRSGILIPYMTYPAPKESILEIIIGPNINIELAKIGLQDYLNKRGINCPISKSDCSLRVL